MLATALGETLPFDEGWLFRLGDPDQAQTLEHDDSQWTPQRLPHDWAIAGPFDQSSPARGEGGYLPTGVAWYRKHFATPSDLGKKRVAIEFDGVMANSDVWINGRHLGHRPNGYVSFQYDLTDHLHSSPDVPNVIAVRTDTSQQVASRWYTGSGVYRHARLRVLDPVHIQYNGVGVTTPRIERDAADAECSVDVINRAREKQLVTVRSTLYDPDGASIGTSEATEVVAAETADILVNRMAIPEPRLWSIGSPRLYTVKNEVLVDGRLTDEETTAFGVRKAEFKADSGFLLNDRNVKIKWVCLHHCGGGVGAAAPLGLWEYRFKRLQELGVNAIRTAHNPVAPEVLDLCDRMGLLVMDEFFDCWKVGKRRYDYHLHFGDWAHRDLRDTILRDRNHPSIILYSVGNEIHDTPHEEQAKQILQGLVQACHTADPSRPVTQALFRPNVSHDYDNGLADMLDVIGTNYRDLELLAPELDKPTRKIIGTEQGHDRRTWLACRDNPQHSGQFLWVGIDYLGESRRWPVTTYNAGLLDRTGSPHPRGYERQSWWSDSPMVQAFRRIAATEQTPTDPGYEVVEWERRQVLFPDWTPRNRESHKETIEVYSNCEEVQLLLNGESLGAKPLPSDASPRRWDVEYAPGELAAVAKQGGAEVARHTLRTAGEARRIQLQVSRTTLPPSWDEVAVVEACVVDEAGTRLPRADDEIAFEIAGPGELVAVDNGSIVSHEAFLANQRKAFQGRCIAIVRAKSAGHSISVTARAKALEIGQVTLRTSE
ncbi:MAG: DUF4982 domain-containing protein [Planctomycetales bacterium]|nr:DUF4982 domain-containing protein [Planctomycetales bacterium]